jgi:hypothetical protein
MYQYFLLLPNKHSHYVWYNTLIQSSDYEYLGYSHFLDYYMNYIVFMQMYILIFLDIC